MRMSLEELLVVVEEDLKVEVQEAKEVLEKCSKTETDILKAKVDDLIDSLVDVVALCGKNTMLTEYLLLRIELINRERGL